MGYCGGLGTKNAEVVLLTSEDMGWSLAGICSGDAYWCVAEELGSWSPHSEGVLYMQFDVALSPCEMAKHLDVQQIGSFQELSYGTFEKLDEKSGEMEKFVEHLENLQAGDLVLHKSFYF